MIIKYLQGIEFCDGRDKLNVTDGTFLKNTFIRYFQPNSILIFVINIFILRQMVHIGIQSTSNQYLMPSGPERLTQYHTAFWSQRDCFTHKSNTTCLNELTFWLIQDDSIFSFVLKSKLIGARSFCFNRSGLYSLVALFLRRTPRNRFKSCLLTYLAKKKIWRKKFGKNSGSVRSFC